MADRPLNCCGQSSESRDEGTSAARSMRDVCALHKIGRH
jgi:hypothetical protein